MCEATASSSWASRVIFHCLAVWAMCSPIDNPVRASALEGVAMPKSVGRRPVRARSWFLGPLARLTLSNFLRSFSLTVIGASEEVSTPPAIPESIWPSLILLETMMAACRPVPQACWTSYAGVVGESAEPSTVSRARLKSRQCLMTAPATTSPTCSPAKPYRATRPSSAEVSMSWLEASAYAPNCRAKGMRLPPRMAALRGLVGGMVTTPEKGERGCDAPVKRAAIVLKYPIPTVAGSFAALLRCPM